MDSDGQDHLDVRFSPKRSLDQPKISEIKRPLSATSGHSISRRVYSSDCGVMNRNMSSFSPRSNLIVQVAFYYGLAIVLLLIATLAADELVGLHNDTKKSIYQICFGSSFLVFLIAWGVRPVAKSDRKVMLVRLLWIYAGWILMFVYFFGFYRFFGRGSFVGGLLIASLFGFAGFLWHSVSSPFAREWALSRCADKDKMLEAESYLNFPFSPQEVEESEIRVSPTIYYGFISVAAAIVLIIADAVVGEFIDTKLSLPGYSGAVVIALLVAAATYPIHSRASKFVSSSSQQKVEEAPSEVHSAFPAVMSGVVRMLRLALLRYPSALFLTVVLGSLFAWVVVLYLPRVFLTIGQ